MPIKGLHVNLEDGIKLKKNAVHVLVDLIKTRLNKKIVSLDINFVGSDTIYFINTKYLGHKYTTDVISFDYSDESNSFDGEIFICFDTAFDNSKRFHVSFDDELKRLIIHGLLHFSGFDDKTKSKRVMMKKAEDELLKRSKKIKIVY